MSNRVTETLRNLTKVTQLCNWQSLDFIPSPCSSVKRLNHYAGLPVIGKVRSQQRSDGSDGGKGHGYLGDQHSRQRKRAKAPRKVLFKDQHQGQCSRGKGRGRE